MSLRRMGGRGRLLMLGGIFCEEDVCGRGMEDGVIDHGVALDGLVAWD
jgi:hypothetical protein